jgi:REP element-mobilizing transposase RayT
MPRGGKRPGAGRKKTGKLVGGPHRVRPFLDPRHPVHVVLRSKRRLNWRNGRTYAVLRRVLGFSLGNPDFRICHISIQQRHLHLIVEAADRKALTLGIQSFTIRAARAINRDRRTRGKVFAFRYHDKQITTAMYARHALAYVLNNWRRHREDTAHKARAAHLDPYSSALSFDGWTRSFRLPPDYHPLPVSPAKTRLLRDDWRWYGLIDPRECPGPIAATPVGRHRVSV